MERLHLNVRYITPYGISKDQEITIEKGDPEYELALWFGRQEFGFEKMVHGTVDLGLFMELYQPAYPHIDFNPDALKQELTNIFSNHPWFGQNWTIRLFKNKDGKEPDLIVVPKQ